MRVSVFGPVLAAVLAFGGACAFAKDLKVQEPLARRFATVFAGEFGDPSAAKEVWETYGGGVLAKVENGIYPPVVYELFRDRALERMRRVRKSRPDLSPELLSFVALDGLAAQPERNVAIAIVRDKTGTAPQGVVVTSVTGEDISAPKRKGSREAGYHAAGDEFPAPVLEIPVLKRDALTDSIRKALAGHKGPVILDLRGNEGGLLTEVPVVAGFFLAPDQTVLVMETKGGARRKLRTDAGAHPIGAGRILVLIDEETNAGALALAVALKEKAGAGIAGARTRRIKDSIESFMLPRTCPPHIRKCALRLPTARLLPPSGRSLDEAVEVDYPADWASAGAGKQVVEKWFAEGR